MIGIEKDADEIVIEDVFAFAHASANLPGGCMADKNDVEILLIPANPGRCLLANRDAISRRTLAEVVDPKHV